MRTMAWHSAWRLGRRSSYRPRRRPGFVEGGRPGSADRQPADWSSGRRRSGSSRRERRRVKGLPLLFGCLLVIAVALAGIDYAVTPVISAWAEQYGRNVAQHAIADAMQEVFRGSGEAEELTHVVETGDGKLIVIPEWARLNRLASNLELGIQDRLDEVVTEQSPVPLGQLLGLNFLAGFGPHIRVQVLSIGALRTTLDSVLREAGINQTLHSIYLRVESTVKILVPTVTEEITVATQVPVSETMLVGDVPEWYMTGSGGLRELPMGAVPLRDEREERVDAGIGARPKARPVLPEQSDP